MESEYALSLVLRFMVAGTVIVAISVAAEKLKNPALAGVLLMMPSLSILSFYFIGKAGGTQAVSDLALAALLTLPVWVAYAVSFYIFLQQGLGLILSMLYSVGIFVAGSAMFLAMRGRFF